MFDTWGFGEFAVGIDPTRAREFGAAPVTYVYSGGDSAHARVSHEVLFSRGALRSLAIALARLEAKAGIEDRDTLDRDAGRCRLRFGGKTIVREQVDAVDRRTTRAAVDLLDTDRRPAWIWT